MIGRIEEQTELYGCDQAKGSAIDPRCFEVFALSEELSNIVPNLVDSLSFSFRIATYALIMPFKLILFTIHNYLTKRDY